MPSLVRYDQRMTMCFDRTGMHYRSWRFGHDHRRCWGRVVGVAVALIVFIPSAALAARDATRREARRIEQTALAACAVKQRYLIAAGDAEGHVPCRTPRPPRVSTVNPSFAYSYAVGEQWSGALLHRSSHHSTHWSIVATQGSGINPCSYWNRHAPPPVIRDLELKGTDKYGYAEECDPPTSFVGGQ